MSISKLPSSLHIQIAPDVLEHFPETKISLLLLRVSVLTKNNQPKEMQQYLSQMKQDCVKKIHSLGVTSENYLETRVCQSWKSVFDSFQTEDNKQSTISSLLRRATQEAKKIEAGKKADLGNISNFVDFYNCISINSMTPMGATDITKLTQKEGEASVTLRFAKPGETFIPLGKDSQEVALTPTSIVYADAEKVLTGFWNWRDSEHCCVPRESSIKPDGNFDEEYLLLVADQAHQDMTSPSQSARDVPGDSEGAILQSLRELHRIGGYHFAMEILSGKRSEVTFDLRNIDQDTVPVSPAVSFQ